MWFSTFVLSQAGPYHYTARQYSNGFQQSIDNPRSQPKQNPWVPVLQKANHQFINYLDELQWRILLSSSPKLHY